MSERAGSGGRHHECAVPFLRGMAAQWTDRSRVVSTACATPADILRSQRRGGDGLHVSTVSWPVTHESDGCAEYLILVPAQPGKLDS